MSDLADRLTDKLQNNSIENSQKATSPAKSEMSGSTDQLDGLAKNAYERRIQRVEDEKKELVRKLENSTRALQKFAHGAPPIVDNDVAAANESNANEIRRLQDELNTLTKRNQGKIQLNWVELVYLIFIIVFPVYLYKERFYLVPLIIDRSDYRFQNHVSKEFVINSYDFFIKMDFSRITFNPFQACKCLEQI